MRQLPGFAAKARIITISTGLFSHLGYPKFIYIFKASPKVTLKYLYKIRDFGKFHKTGIYLQNWVPYTRQDLKKVSGVFKHSIGETHVIFYWHV